MLDITILCKVVDNFGDVGVVYRLSRALSELKQTRPDFPELKLRIVIDNLDSFSLLEPKISPEKEFQICNGWEIYNWNAAKTSYDAFKQNPPQIIFECFQCGRPDWLEKLLFDEKVPNLVDIIMLDYLTAEDYAETFHKLKSLTRSARVQKVNFMMGFTEKTGGFILDKPFIDALKNNEGKSLSPGFSTPTSCASFTTPLSSGDIRQAGSPQRPSFFNLIFFSYPRNCSPIVNAFAHFNASLNGRLNVKLAKGAGFDSFKTAYESYAEKTVCKARLKTDSSLKNATPSEIISNDKTFSLQKLPFLSQIEWDSLLTETPLLFIRGEDSLSRACLCGKPFVWHAYPQSEEYQLVKVKALLERMRPFFTAEQFEIVEKCWLVYNQSNPDSAELESALTKFLMNYETLKCDFKAFSDSLLKNGNLAEHIIEFTLERQKVFQTGQTHYK